MNTSKHILAIASSLLLFNSINGQVIELKSEIKKQPNSFGQANLSSGFLDANGGTTDLYSKNSKKKDFQIPNNYMGIQEADKGDAYYGIIAYYADGTFDAKKFFRDGFSAEKPGYTKYSEYVQLPIGSKLKAGQQYIVSFKVSLSDKSAYAISGLGAHLSENQISEKKNSRLNLTPQISSERLINTKDKWEEVSGYYTANGNENYITIGSFNKNLKAEKIVSNNEMNNRKAYYYISGIKFTEYVKPDVDNDGIVDEDDKCPTVKGIAKFLGCPDSDNDGIEDSKDKCPSVFGLTSFSGCPDTDNDGISDNEDNCPNISGLITNKGCPEIKVNDKAKAVFQKAMSGIQFETGKDVIKKTSYPILDNVVTVLKENPDWNIEVQGHTDNVGKYDSNKALSDKRAIAVKKYLESKGVSNKMASNGYGSDKPIADNKTPQGRAKNRRVEFNVTYLQ